MLWSKYIFFEEKKFDSEEIIHIDETENNHENHDDDDNEENNVAQSRCVMHYKTFPSQTKLMKCTFVEATVAARFTLPSDGHLSTMNVMVVYDRDENIEFHHEARKKNIYEENSLKFNMKL